jgi:hypothetical protein
MPVSRVKSVTISGNSTPKAAALNPSNSWIVMIS